MRHIHQLDTQDRERDIPPKAGKPHRAGPEKLNSLYGDH